MHNRNNYEQNSQKARTGNSSRPGALLLEILTALALTATLALGIARYQWHLKSVQCEALKRLRIIQEVNSTLESQLIGRDSDSGCIVEKSNLEATFHLETGERFAAMATTLIKVHKDYIACNGPRRCELKTVVPERAT